MKSILKIKKTLIVCVLFLSFVFGATAEDSLSIKPFFFRDNQTNVNVSKNEASFVSKDSKTTLINVDRMFWELNGFDKNGKPSKVYMLGTIHVGDERLYPLPQTIEDAFNRADIYAAEISSEDMSKLQMKMIKVVSQSAAKARGRNVLEELTEEEKVVLCDLMDERMVKQLAMFEPWLIYTTVSSLQYEKSGLTANMGMDTNLMGRLTKEKKPWEGLDDIETQLNIIQFGDYDQQLYILKSTLDSLIEPSKVNEYIHALYQAYLEGNIARVGDLEEEDLSMPQEGEVTPEIEEFMKEYSTALLNDRNSAWADKIKDYLNQGGTTFIFAGCAHFSGDNSVFRYLKENGTIGAGDSF